MEPILTIDNLNSFGGNMLRQGDKSQLKYRLRDVGNKNLGISGKSCEIKMYGRNYTTVVYETTTTVSSDNTVSFTIGKVLPKGTFYLEFTVGDYIFPTDHREFFEITPSGKGMEANIIEIVGVDAVVRKAVDLINKDPNLIVDEDKLVNDIISNTGIGNINEYYKAFNDLKPRAELSISKSAEALTKSQNALNVANGIDAKATNALSLSESADTLSKSVQEQLNQVVIDGDSSPMADQARVDDKGVMHSSLKGRIDSSDLAKYRIKNGKIKLPTGFPQLPFDIFKVGDWNYTHNATPHNQHDWSTATEVFIAGLGATTGSGTSVDSPIELGTFYNNVREDVYGEQDDFILSFVNTYYTIHSSLNLGQLQKNIYARSVSLKGKTYMNQFSFQGTSGISEPWSEDGNIFKTTANSSRDMVPINVGAGEDEFGISNPHIPVSSVSEVRDKVGAYYYDYNNRTMYLHPYPSESINDVEVFWKPSNHVLEVSNTSDNILMFENLHFINGHYRFAPSTTGTKLYFFGCNFYRGAQDAFGITGKFTVYLFDCVGAYPNKDAFNYHTTDENSLAVEINGRGYGAGQYKYINEGNQGRASNNGSTAHDGMYMLRVGGEYWECEGPIIADVGNCYSINIGCRSFDILPTATTSLMTGLYVETPVDVTLEEEKPKYFIECEQHGKYFTQGVRGVGSNKTYVQAVNVDIGEGHLINWEDVV